MTSKSKCIVGTSDEGLLSIPPELITRILCRLPSFTDVFVFAATCHQLRDIWTSSATAVYTEVAPRCIPCLPRARILLADQGRIDPDSPQVSAKDVVQMVHNAHVIDHATEHFEREIVPSTKVGGIPHVDLERWYGKGVHRHPPHLTHTERIRFTRSYYLLWGLMTLPPAAWQPRLERLTLKQLYHLLEMSTLTQSIGRGEEVISPSPQLLNEKPYSRRAINHGRSQKRVSLQEAIWAQLESAFERIHHSSPEGLSAYSLEEGSMGGSIVMWDHWQGSLKELVCLRRPNAKRPLTDSEIQYCWGESEDEEGEGKREDAESWLLEQQRSNSRK